MRNSTLTAKKLLVVVLAVVLAAVCVGTSTFSWFGRPVSGSGNALSYAVSDADDMVAYDGHGITMTHEFSSNDGVTFESIAAPHTTRTLGTQPYDYNNPTALSNRVYYKTTLMNTTTSPQNVSLYIQGLNTGSDGEVCVGVNEPIKAFKNYSHMDNPKPSPSSTIAEGPTTKRIYFETYSGRINNWYRTDKLPQVCYGTATTDMGNNGSNANWTELTWRKNGSGSKLYYADLPANTEQLFFTVGDDWGGSPYKRSQTFTSLSGDGLSRTQSLIFKVADWYDQTYDNCHVDKEKVKGLFLTNYYNAASLGKGDTINLSLLEQWYGGGSGSTDSSVSYSITSGSAYASVNSSGVVTGLAKGTATLTYTVTSQHEDTLTKTCTITVNEYNSSQTYVENAPIVTNLLIPAATTEGQRNTDGSNVQEVYWFIQNGDEMYGTADENATYTIRGVYLGV